MAADWLRFAQMHRFAHHSFSAEYDEKKLITVTGVVTKFEWMNPHVRFYVDVKDRNGTATNLDFELMSPNTLRRAGWNSHALNVGDEVTVTAYVAHSVAAVPEKQVSSRT
jgi:hypothetical protein